MLKMGDNGLAVKSWQVFLNKYNESIEYEWVALSVNGIFDKYTLVVTKLFQEKMGLVADGIVGAKTLNTARDNGFSLFEYPSEPDFSPLTGAQREELFGKFNYEVIAGTGNIIVSSSWTSNNLTRIKIPQIVKAKGAPKSGEVFINKKIVDQTLAFFQEVESSGFIDLIMTWDGLLAQRFVRGSNNYLSNHCWGTAFDINAMWNMMGRLPAIEGETGSVIELVDIANRYGFYWGGHFKSPDGMHFECAKIL